MRAGALVPWQREEAAALLGGPCWQGEVWSMRGIPLPSLGTGLTAACHTTAQAGFKNGVLTSKSQVENV